MKKAIIVLLAALAVIAGVVAFKNVYSCDIPIKNRGIRDAINTGDLDVLFIGSSTFRANIDMHMMDEVTDGRVYDVSYGGNHMVATQIQYEEIKKRSPYKYGLIAFEMGPMILTQQTDLSDSRVIWDLSWEGKKELWKKMEESGTTTKSMMYEYFVTSGIDDLATYFITEPFYGTRYYKGAKTEETVSPGKEVLERAEFDISEKEFVPAQIEAVNNIIDMCRADGQEFIFVESPCYHKLADDEKYKECLERFREILDEKEAPYITAEDVDFDNTNADFFEDMNHMSAKGKQEYTKELIKKIL